MKVKLAIVAVFAAAVIAIVAFSFLKGPSVAGPAASATAEPSARPPASDVTEISMLYSTEKKDWIEAAAVDFRKNHPEIKLTLVGKGSYAAAQAIVDDKEKPTLFSPADSLALNLASSDWRTKGRGDLFAASGEDAPQSLVITPLVFVVWEDRAEVLLKASKGAISWRSLHKAISSNQGWPAIGGKPAWGFVKLGHTDPTQSNSGLQALYLMSLEYFAKPAIEVGELLKPDYQTFVREVEKGVSKYETSTGVFMTEMVRFGPSKYDIAVVYENLAVSEIEHAQGRWGNLRVYYPSTTLWSDHPAALLQADWVTDAQKKAARAWIAHLRSRAVQERALGFGFRPGDPAVPVKTADAQNPYTRLAQYGIQVEIPPVAKTPDSAVVRNLMMMWSRVAAPAQ